MLLQKLDHIMILVMYCICKRLATPTIFGINISTSIQQQLSNITKPLTSSHM
ncbi:hypothetical protein HanPSC8_Chr04g0167581 [Helianthus annuus]|nr:hypothetical protein HanPSC8_Chr04g0167581 [Helianthus annuus]